MHEDDDDSYMEHSDISAEASMAIVTSFLSGLYKRMPSYLTSKSYRTHRILPPAILAINSTPLPGSGGGMEWEGEEWDSSSQKERRRGYRLTKVIEWTGLSSGSKVPPGIPEGHGISDSVNSHTAALLWIGPDGQGRHEYLLACRDGAYWKTTDITEGPMGSIIPGMWHPVSDSSEIPTVVAKMAGRAWH